MAAPIDPKTIQDAISALLKSRLRLHSGVVIASTAVLEDGLRQTLKKAMRPMSATLEDRIFESFGPLSTFNTRILMAYALGLLNDDTFKELEAMRKIRNEFAHAITLVDFETEKIAHMVKAMGWAGDGDITQWWLARVKVVADALDAYTPPSQPSS